MSQGNAGYDWAQRQQAAEEAVPKRKAIEGGQETFGQKLARLRKDAGYSQSELAAELGISKRMVAYYEGETDHPPTTLLPALARVLNVTPDQMLGFESIAPRKRTVDNRLWRRFKQIEQLSTRERREVIKLLDVFLDREWLKKASGSNVGR
jgi:transcriptional regulator with XRE-family HTH domain